MFGKQTIELTAPVLEWLSAFERLSPEEQMLAARQIQKRFEKSSELSDDEELDMSPISPDEMTFLAARLFAMYDEEERQNGCP